MDLKWWDVPEVRPDRQTEVPERYRFVVLDEECLAGSGLRGNQVLRNQYVGICNVRHIRDIPKVIAVANYIGGLALANTCVDRRNQLIVARSAEYRGPESTGRHRGA